MNATVDPIALQTSAALPLARRALAAQSSPIRDLLKVAQQPEIISISSARQ
jgi:hypothetical protein